MNAVIRSGTAASGQALSGQAFRIKRLDHTGFTVSSHYLSGLAYRYVASRRAQLLLPVYNFIDRAAFGLGAMERLRPFVLTAGAKG